MILFTDAAIEAAKSLLEKRKTPNARIRVGVKGSGGCEGFVYHLQFEDNPPREKDCKFFFNGIRVLVDFKSMVMLKDVVVDYKKTLIESGFDFFNPAEKSKCGCEKSFSI
jgi:iron-sulfur cluster assembly accessory protein